MITGAGWRDAATARERRQTPEAGRAKDQILTYSIERERGPAVILDFCPLGRWEDTFLGF